MNLLFQRAKRRRYRVFEAGINRIHVVAEVDNKTLSLRIQSVNESTVVVIDT